MTSSGSFNTTYSNTRLLSPADFSTLLINPLNRSAQCRNADLPSQAAEEFELCRVALYRGSRLRRHSNFLHHSAGGMAHYSSSARQAGHQETSRTGNQRRNAQLTPHRHQNTRVENDTPSFPHSSWPLSGISPRSYRPASKASFAMRSSAPCRSIFRHLSYAVKSCK